jgi:trimeric autotransporter adhesin
MKTPTLLTLILLTATVALSQGVAINETGAAPDPSAMLDVTSTSKGLLVPRMTIAQRNAIVLPNPGLLIFQTDATPGFYYNANTASSPTGSAWATVQPANGQ